MVRGHLKLIDFGIADAIQGDTTNVLRDNVVGTLNFIAPEALSQSSGAGSAIRLGRSADVWSLGCILHRMLFDEHLFPATNQFGKIAALTCKSVTATYCVV
jgi:serine/threonine-protein kinase TTK/MPS1